MATEPGAPDRRRRTRRLSDVPLAASPPPREGAPDRTRAGWVAGLSLVVALVSTTGWVLSSAGTEGDRGHALTQSVYVLLAVGAAVLLLAVLSGGLRFAAWPRRGGPWAVRAIQRAIEKGEFELHYQPQIDVATGQPVAVEALLRWRRRGELCLPADFLPGAEASSAIGPLTDHVLDLGLAQAGTWHRAGRTMRVSMNLSAANLRDAGLAGRIEALLAKHDVRPELITLEVTETAVLEEPEQTRGVLDTISELGVSISVDDFGTGYSSLLWLRLFPVREVKIDRTFVSQMEIDGRAYVSGVIRLAHDLGLRVVAEGIEDEAALQTLQELGCDIGQGFLFSKGVPPGLVESWLDGEMDPGWAPPRHELHMQPDYGTVDEARQLIHDSATELGFDDEAIWDIKVATTEALGNAIEHGAVAGDGLIHLHVSREDGAIQVEISGGGNLGDKSKASSGQRGRGIAIMNALMDEVTLRREADDTLIKLAKRPAPRG